MNNRDEKIEQQIEIKTNQVKTNKDNRPIFTKSDCTQNKQISEEPIPDCCFIKTFCCCLTKMKI